MRETKKVELDEEEITITVASGIRQGCIESTNFQTSDIKNNVETGRA